MDTLGTKILVLSEMSSVFQGKNNMYLYRVGTQSTILINQVSLFERCPLREVPLYLGHTYYLCCCSSIYMHTVIHILMRFSAVLCDDIFSCVV